MSRIELAVFDLDGTLVHLEYDHFYAQVARIFPQIGGVVPDRKDLLDLIRNHELYHCFEEKHRQDRHNLFWQQFDFSDRPAARMLPGAIETIETLVKQGYEIAIATARTEAVELVRDYLEPVEINQHISVISTFVGQSWRDKTQQLLNVCNHLGIAPKNALMAGDTPGDIVSARNAGFAIEVAVLTGESAPHIFEKVTPHLILEDVSPIPEIIEQYHDSPTRFRRS